MIQCGHQHLSRSQRIREVINPSVNLNLNKWWTTIQCVWRMIQNYSSSQMCSVVINTAGQVKNTVRWLTLQGKWTIQCDDQQYSASECWSAVITIVQVNVIVRRSTLKCQWRTLNCSHQHYSCSERYNKINTTVQFKSTVPVTFVYLLYSAIKGYSILITTRV
jgi:hypothetical protein